MIVDFSWGSKASTPVNHSTVSKINSFKVLQTTILQGLKWKVNPDCCRKVSRGFTLCHNWANSIWCRIWWSNSRRQPSSSSPPERGQSVQGRHKSSTHYSFSKKSFWACLSLPVSAKCSFLAFPSLKHFRWPLVLFVPTTS